MKKAILNLGFLSIMMMFMTSFSTDDTITVEGNDHVGKGMYIGSGKKLDYLQLSATHSKYIEYGSKGQVINTEKKFE